jgi:DNA (cytosine-5)-methyltransferase 1
MIGSLFSGYSGLDRAAQAVFGQPLAFVTDIEPGPCKILAHRHPDVPNLGDVTAIDWTPWRDRITVLTGGFPCTDVSLAGRRAGLIRGETRSGLWSEMHRAIVDLRPRYVLIENVRGLLSAEADSDLEPCPWCVGDDTDGALRALGAVLGDLADAGYDARWCGLRAADLGACHGRYRVFILAHRGNRNGSELAWETGPAARPALTLLPTPDATPGRKTSRTGPLLAGALLPTPRSTDGSKGGPNQRGSSGDLMLPSAVHLLPTPTSSAYGSNQCGCAPWGHYAPAIHRWELIIGRPAPAPTGPTGRDGARRLSARAVEWMMGLPLGWVTDVPGITRAEALRALGNGVVPLQAEAALRHMLDQEVPS